MSFQMFEMDDCELALKGTEKVHGKDLLLRCNSDRWWCQHGNPKIGHAVDS